MTGNDIYQKRYLNYQKKRPKMLSKNGEEFAFYSSFEKRSFIKLIKNRRSQRFFDDDAISSQDLKLVYETIRLAPSSCNRQAIYIKQIYKVSEKRKLSLLLVGGYRWIYKAGVILLVYADTGAYKSPGEISYMPYLDAGVIVGSVYLAAEVSGLTICYVNPNIREKDKKTFNKLFNPKGYLFCGAVALGKCAIKAKSSPKRKITEMFIG